MNPEADIAQREARATLSFSEGVMGQLQSCQQVNGACDFTMSPRHAQELHRYLEAHRMKMSQALKKMEASVLAEEEIPAPAVNLLAGYRFDLDAAMRFVSEAFIKPRRSAGSAQVLEAADWMCVEGFRIFLDHAKVNAGEHPVGPIVALDSQRSPAVWREDAELRIPSLFAESIPIREKGRDAARMLPPFPVICLPSDLAELPEYYALLSHEVGHAVDSALELSIGILGELPAWEHRGYWVAWMREIVADAVGIALSGGAFAVALWRFAGRRALDRKLSESNIYPPMELRLLFLRSTLNHLGSTDGKALGQIPDSEVLANLPELAKPLRDYFESTLLPLLQKWIFAAVADWEDHEKAVVDAVNPLRGNRAPEWDENKESVVIGAERAGLKFRLVPSVFTLAIAEEGDSRVRARFKGWHEIYRNHAKPEWIREQSNWRFTENDLPSLRATLLGPDGITKYPPVTLLAAHQRISFLGATNKSLLEAIKDATKERKGVPWEQIDVFFASDSLLLQVERYDKQNQKLSLQVLKDERDFHLSAIEGHFRSNPGMIKKWSVRTFDGPALFGAFWDWNERGGRIHASVQLLGVDIGKCPSLDHIWLREEPTPTYKNYVNHLENLEKRATLISHDLNYPVPLT